MRKVSLVLLVAAMVIFIFGKNYCMALDVKFDYSPSKDVQQNLLSTVNLHSGYSVLAYGVEKVFDQNKAWQRGAEIIVESQLAIGLSILGHEGGHDYYGLNPFLIKSLFLTVLVSSPLESMCYTPIFCNLPFWASLAPHKTRYLWCQRTIFLSTINSLDWFL